MELLHQYHEFIQHTCILSRFFDNMEAEEAIMRDRETQEAILKKELEEITTILEQLALVLLKRVKVGPL